MIGRYVEATIESEEEFLLLPSKEYSSRNKTMQEPECKSSINLSAPQKRHVIEYDFKFKSKILPLLYSILQTTYQAHSLFISEA